MSEKEIAQEGVFDAPEEDDFEVGSSEIEEEYDLEDEDAEMAMDMAEDESDDELGVFEDEPVYAVDFLPGTDLLATGGGNDRALLLDTGSFEQLADLGGFGDSVIEVKFSKHSLEDLYLAAASLDGSIRVFSTSEAEGLVVKCVLEGAAGDADTPCGVTWIDWHPRGSVLAAGFEDGSIWLWNVSATDASGLCNPMTVFAGLIVGAVTFGCFTPDGKTVLAGGEDGSVFLLSPSLRADNQVVAKLSSGIMSGPITKLAMAGSVVCCGDAEGTLKLFKCVGGSFTLLSTLLTASSLQNNDGESTEENKSIEGVAFHETTAGALLAACSMSGILNIWMVTANCSIRHELGGLLPLDDREGWTQLLWLPGWDNCGNALLACSSLGRLVLFDGLSGHLMPRQLKGHYGSPVLNLSYSKEKKTLAVAFDDGSVALYN